MSICLSFIFLLFFLVGGNALAGDFTSSYNTTYKILENGETQVINNIDITNDSEKIYATTYKLTVNNIKIYDISAFQKGTQLKTELVEDGANSKISVFFKYQVIGIASKLSFNLNFKTKDIAFVKGKVLEVYIPKISGLNNTNLYNMSLEVPTSYGPVMYISPNPSKETGNTKTRTFYFSKEQIKNNPVVAGFGESQLFNFKLSYDLENKDIFSKNVSIAFPPDIKNRQQVLVNEINIKPNKVVSDKDGNTIAIYRLKGNSTLKVQIKGVAKLINKYIDMKSGGPLDQIPKHLVNNYTTPQNYWETKDSKIIDIAKSLKDPNLTVAQNAFKAYQFVITNLKYQEAKTQNKEVRRLGSNEALLNPNEAICMEFVDLFIAITRAMGIPSRELDGYAYTKNSSLAPLSINLKGGDILHAWAEFYDPNLSWVQIDPTWGNTSDLDYFSKLDTNHFAFVIKGASSVTPLPAGAYKNGVDSTPQVDVDFDSQERKETAKYSISAENKFSINLFELLKGKGKYKIKNTGNATIFDIKNTNVKILPPLGETFAYLNPKEKIEFTDFENKTKQIDLTKVSPPLRWRDLNFSVFSFFLIALLTLSLCTTLYFLKARLKSLKK